MSIEFFIPGIPKPGGSKRAFQHRTTGRIIVTDDCKKNADWKRQCAFFAGQAYKGEPLSGPLSLTVEFAMPRPKGHFGSGKNADKVRASAPLHPTTKPDATKLLRCLEDAMTGILWRDDAQIVHQVVRKSYSPTPGASVWVTETND